MRWIYLLIAGALEITWAVAMKMSNGFTVLIFFRFGRLTCEILDQPNKDDFVRKYIRKDIKYKLASFRMMFIL